MEKVTFRELLKEGYASLTVDWIVLTASIIGLAIVVLASIHAGDDSLAANVSSFFTSADRS